LLAGASAIRPIHSGFKVKHPSGILAESLLLCFEIRYLHLRYLNTHIKKYRYLVAVIFAMAQFVHRWSDILPNKLQAVTLSSGLGMQSA
jgi:hypothetical protein